MDAEKIIVYIATGKSRRETVWHNEEWTWEKLAARLGQTHRTAERVKDYAAATKARRAEIKDVGGFVGGYLTGGRRKKDAVLERSLVTLDADYAPESGEAWERFKAAWPGVAAVCYSTHSHTEEAPRVRLVVPLSRAVSAAEYEPIARRVAEGAGIEAFDETTYEAARLMYWPSTPADGAFFYARSEGAALDADAVLAGYRDWRDASEWPVSARRGEAVRTEMRKAGDPTEKTGVVGWFCRTYGMRDAIEKYLGDVYTPTATDGRYTYAPGTTAGGLVVYDDKWAYSHHGSDPAGGQLCNAFDLVRLHLFGDDDAACRAETPVQKRPSFAAMEELAMRDGAVRRTAMAERAKEAAQMFAGVAPEEEEKGDTAWTAELDLTKRGEVKATIPNIRLILDHDPALAGKVARDSFAHRDKVVGDLPWRKAGGAWGNSDDANLRGYLEERYQIASQQKVYDAFEVAMTARAYHPVRDYLAGLRWDGRERLDTLLTDYLGAEDTAYTRAVTRMALTAAVARVMEPGCKFDYALILQGGEGIGKSTLLRTLGGEWFSDSVTTLGGKEGMESLQGVWIVELAELMSIRRAEVEATKAFISRQTDEFRPAYARKKESYPRQCVFFGTTNEDTPLRGDTGNRRFWLVRCGGGARKDPWRDLPAERDQLWAEAKARWEAGETLYLDRATERVARGVQEAANELASDPRIGQIEEYLRTALPMNWYSLGVEERRVWFSNQRRGMLPVDGDVEPCTMEREKVSAVEILVECFGMPLTERARYATRDINALMDYVKGWKRTESIQKIPGYGKQRVFIPDEENS